MQGYYASLSVFTSTQTVYCLDICKKNANLFHHTLRPDINQQAPLYDFSSQPPSLLIPQHIYLPFL